MDLHDVGPTCSELLLWRPTHTASTLLLREVTLWLRLGPYNYGLAPSQTGSGGEPIHPKHSLKNKQDRGHTVDIEKCVVNRPVEKVHVYIILCSILRRAAGTSFRGALPDFEFSKFTWGIYISGFDEIMVFPYPWMHW